SHIIDELLRQPPPNGPVPAAFQSIRGYAEGYDRYLRDVGGSKGIPDPRCKGQPWVKPITAREAWRRFYQLILLAGYDVVIPGNAVQMQPRKVTVTEKTAGGKLRTVTHTLWWTKYGPVFDDLVGVPLPWTTTTAFAIRDVNVRNFRALNHFFEFDRARTTL